MNNNFPGAPITDQLMQPMLESLLDGLIEHARKQGCAVNVAHDENGYLIEFGMPGEPQNTVAGDTTKEAVDGLVRNLTQAGLLPTELREMQLQLDHQIRLIRDPVMEQINSDIARVFGLGASNA